MQAFPKLTQKQRDMAEQFFPLAKQQAARFYHRFYRRMSLDDLESAAYYGLVKNLAQWHEDDPPPAGVVVWWMRHQMWADAPWQPKLARMMFCFSALDKDDLDYRFDPAEPPGEEPAPAVPENIEEERPTPRWLRIAWKWHVQHDCDIKTDECELREALKELPDFYRRFIHARELNLRSLAGHIEFTIRFAHHRLSAREIVAAVRDKPSAVAAALDLLARENRVIRSGQFFDVPSH